MWRYILKRKQIQTEIKSARLRGKLSGSVSCATDPDPFFLTVAAARRFLSSRPEYKISHSGGFAHMSHFGNHFGGFYGQAGIKRPAIVVAIRG
jgi:hypothetical protein